MKNDEAENETDKVPAFQMYPNDFEGDPNVKLLDNEELGAYVRLIFVAWAQADKGILPLDEEKLAKWSRMGRRWARSRDAILACFRITADGRIIQKRLVKEYEKIVARRAERKEAGSRGGKAKAERARHLAELNDESSNRIAKLDDSHDFARGNNLAKPASSSSSSSSLSEITPTRAKAPDQLWLEAVGLQPGAGLLDAWMLAKDAAPAKGKAPEAYFAEALGAFVAWVDGCKASRRPQKSPQKFVEHFARIQEILDGNRAAVPVETPAPLTHDPRSPLPSRPRDAVKPGEGGVRDLSRG